MYLIEWLVKVVWLQRTRAQRFIAINLWPSQGKYDHTRSRRPSWQRSISVTRLWQNNYRHALAWMLPWMAWHDGMTAQPCTLIILDTGLMCQRWKKRKRSVWQKNWIANRAENGPYQWAMQIPYYIPVICTSSAIFCSASFHLTLLWYSLLATSYKHSCFSYRLISKSILSSAHAMTRVVKKIPTLVDCPISCGVSRQKLAWNRTCSIHASFWQVSGTTFLSQKTGN